MLKVSMIDSPNSFDHIDFPWNKCQIEPFLLWLHCLSLATGVSEDKVVEYVRAHWKKQASEGWNCLTRKQKYIDHVSDAFTFSQGSSSYSKRGGQADNRSAVEDSGRKGSGSSTTKVQASPPAPDRKKSGTPSTVSQNIVCLNDPKWTFDSNHH